MSRPHPVLLALAADRPPESVPTRDDGLLASALDHAMQGLLWSWVRDHEPAYSERARLAGTDLATRQRHHRLWSTLAEVRDRCAAIGVDVATIKGVTTEARWYRRPGERPSGDVDVLVAPDGVARGEVLRVLDPGHPLVGDLGDLVRSGSVQAVTLDLGGVAVDVHFDLLKLGYPMRSPETVWEHTVSFVCPDGATVRVLAPEAALVHLLVHANKDSFPRLLGYADVARIAGHDLDWDLVVRLLAREGLEDVAACALARVQGTLGLARGPLGAARVAAPPRVARGLARADDAARQRGDEPLTTPGGAPVPGAWSGDRRHPLGGADRAARPGGGRAPVRRRPRVVPRSARCGPVADDRRAGPVVAGATGAAPDRCRRRASMAWPRPGCCAARLAGGPLWLDVAGTSMGWSIPDGARVRVVAADRPRSGQVWAFCAPEGAIVVHRARRVGRDGTVFQGDACVAADPPAAADRLVGRVIEVSVAGGTLRWGRWAGALQRVPRAAVARTVRVARGVRAGAGG